MAIVYLPLDERPVNTDLVVDIGALAGVDLLLPPADLLPRERVGGDTAGIGSWLTDAVDAGGVSAIVASLDMIAYGGLIPSRTTQDSVVDALTRIGVLETIKQRHPDLPIHVVSLVMRASNSYSNGEEPEYWDTYGRDLHAYGGDQHKAFLARVSGDLGVSAVTADVPADLVLDFEHRRLRNHMVNLAAVDAAAREVYTTLVVTSDDTAVYAGGSLEQVWLQTWAHILPGADGVSFYPGADEVGAVLLARALGRGADQPVTIAAVCEEPGGWDRVADYENMPLQQATRRQIEAAGATPVSAAGEADVVLVLHAPAPMGFRRWQENFGADGDGPIDRTMDSIREHVSAGRRVALADIRYTNGSDPGLTERLEAEGLLPALCAYGGWNTAGNTVGTVIATAVAGVLADWRGELDPVEVERLWLHRVLEDSEYQAVLREEVGLRFYNRGIPMHGGEHFPNDDEEAAVVAEITRTLQAAADRITEPGRWQVTNVHMPWHRLFEVAFTLVRG